MSKEKISMIILTITGTVIVVDAILEQFYQIGMKQNFLILGYCIAFRSLTIKFPNILKRKCVIIPLSIMIVQTFYSLIITYIN